MNDCEQFPVCIFSFQMDNFLLLPRWQFFPCLFNDVICSCTLWITIGNSDSFLYFYYTIVNLIEVCFIGILHKLYTIILQHALKVAQVSSVICLHLKNEASMYILYYICTLLVTIICFSNDL